MPIGIAKVDLVSVNCFLSDDISQILQENILLFFTKERDDVTIYPLRSAIPGPEVRVGKQETTAPHNEHIAPSGTSEALCHLHQPM